LVIARCSVDYVGRLTSHLPEATRLLIHKADGSLLVHSDGGSYKPLNWMSPPAVFRTLEPDDDQLDAGIEEIWEVTHKKSGDKLRVQIYDLISDSDHHLGVDPGLTKDGVEAHLQELLAAQIERLGDGHHLVRRGRDQAPRRDRRRRAAHPLPRAHEPRPAARPGYRRVRGAGNQAAGAHAR
jgi:RecB family endonuclease NucS